MVVTAEGGACECVSCGASCPGRFTACAAVVAVPGRVPSSAPAWARPGAERDGVHVARSVGQPGVVPSRGSAPPPRDGSRGSVPDRIEVDARLTEMRELLGSLHERAAEGEGRTTASIVEAIDALTEKLLDRDERIAGAFMAFDRRQAELADEVRKLTAAIERVAGEGRPRLADTSSTTVRRLRPRKN